MRFTRRNIGLSVQTAEIDALAVTDAKIATGVDAVKIADGSVSNTEFQYINSLTSNVQTQLNSFAKLEKLATYKAPNDADSSYTYTPGTALDLLDAYSEIIVVFTIHNRVTTITDLELRINQVATGYVNRGMFWTGAAVSSYTGYTTGADIGSSNINAVASVGCSGAAVIRRERSGGGNTKGFGITSITKADLGGTGRGGEINNAHIIIDSNTITEIKIISDGGIWEEIGRAHV